MHFRRSLSFVSLGFEWAISDLVLGQSLDGGRPPHVAARVEFLVPALDHTPRFSDRGLGFGSASRFREYIGDARSSAHRSMVADSPDVRNAFGLLLEADVKVLRPRSYNYLLVGD